MKKIRTILRLTALGLALYYTVSVIAYMGITALCKWAYPHVEGGVVLKAIVDGLYKTNPVTMRIMVVIIIIAIAGDHGKFFQVLFDILVGWGTMMLWRILAVQVPEILQGMFCDVTLSIFMTALTVVLIEARVRFARKNSPVVAEEEMYDDEEDNEGSDES